MSPECTHHHITGTSEGRVEPQERCPEGRQLRVTLPQCSIANTAATDANTDPSTRSPTTARRAVQERVLQVGWEKGDPSNPSLRALLQPSPYRENLQGLVLTHQTISSPGELTGGGKEHDLCPFLYPCKPPWPLSGWLNSSMKFSDLWNLGNSTTNNSNGIPLATGGTVVVFPHQQIKTGAFLYVSSGNQCFLGISYKELSNPFDCHPEALGLLYDLAQFFFPGRYFFKTVSRICLW